MKNFVFISPNFPTNYWKFCRELKNNGLNVLGVGDQPYDELMPELKDSPIADVIDVFDAREHGAMLFAEVESQKCFLGWN